MCFQPLLLAKKSTEKNLNFKHRKNIDPHFYENDLK